MPVGGLNEVGDGSFESCVHGEGYSRSPEALVSGAWNVGCSGSKEVERKCHFPGIKLVEKQPQITLGRSVGWLRALLEALE